MITRIKIFKNNNDKSSNMALKLEKKLKANHYEVVSDNFDLGIAVGGDGSFLRMVKECSFNSDILYVGINSGTLGFLQEVKEEDIDSFVKNLNENNYKISEIGIQETLIKHSDNWSKFYSLNEIVIREKELNTAFLKVSIDNHLLENFTGDGSMIATSVGSTVYNLSFGGSIVYDFLHTLQITPIAPLNNKAYRSLLNSIIIPVTNTITIVPAKDKNNLLITIDGENSIYDNVLSIETSIKNKRIKLLRLMECDFTDKINEKFLKDY